MALSSVGARTNILLDVGTNELEVIEFMVGNQHFGINVAKVKQVVQWRPEEMTAMPETPPSIRGMIYYRGHPVTLVDLRIALAIQGPAVEVSRQLVLITEFNDQVTAFLIDKVDRIHRLSWKQLEPFQEFLPGVASYIVACVQVQERLLMLLDLEHLMSVLTPESSILASRQDMESVKPDTRRGDLTIMYAEDSGLIRRMTVDQLQAAGFTKLLVFENGLVASLKIREFHQQALETGQPLSNFFNLLLTDIEMPQMDGLTLCKILKQELQHAEIPVIIYSSLINEPMALKCQAVGSNANISKPKISHIINTIDQELGVIPATS